MDGGCSQSNNWNFRKICRFYFGNGLTKRAECGQKPKRAPIRCRSYPLSRPNCNACFRAPTRGKSASGGSCSHHRLADLEPAAGYHHLVQRADRAVALLRLHGLRDTALEGGVGSALAGDPLDANQNGPICAKKSRPPSCAVDDCRGKWVTGAGGRRSRSGSHRNRTAIGGGRVGSA